MVSLSQYLVDEQATLALGQQLGICINPGVIIFLRGDLGAGKTTLCRGVLRAQGYGGAVKSPTYTLVEAYGLREWTFYHFDLYRLGDAEELEYMGIRDYFYADSICLIEWPERGEDYLPKADLDVHLTVAERGGRNLIISANSVLGNNILASIWVQRRNKVVGTD